jgi:hypothetical protein
MQPDELVNYNQAVSLARAGSTAEAHTLLDPLCRAHFDDPNVVLWWAFTSSSLEEASYGINRVKELDPTNAALPGAYDWLAQQQAARGSISASPAPSYQNNAVQSSNGLLAEDDLLAAYAEKEKERNSPAPTAPSSSASFKSPSAEAKAQAAGEGEGTSEGTRPPLVIAPQPAGLFSLGNILMLVVGLIAIVAIVVAVLIFMQGNVYGVGEMPPPDGGAVFDLTQYTDTPIDPKQPTSGTPGDTLRKLGFTGFGAFVVNNPNQKATDIKAFYQAKMTSKGWQDITGTDAAKSVTNIRRSGLPAVNNVGGTSLLFQKGTKFSSINITNPQSKDSLKELKDAQNDPKGFFKDFKTGDMFIVLLELDTSKIGQS